MARQAKIIKSSYPQATQLLCCPVIQTLFDSTVRSIPARVDWVNTWSQTRPDTDRCGHDRSSYTYIGVEGVFIFKKKFAREKNTELCTLPHGLSSPTYTRMTKEMVTIEILKPSVVIIQIRNKAVARSYLDAYELLWKQLKKR